MHLILRVAQTSLIWSRAEPQRRQHLRTTPQEINRLSRASYPCLGFWPCVAYRFHAHWKEWGPQAHENASRMMCCTGYPRCDQIRFGCGPMRRLSSS